MNRSLIKTLIRLISVVDTRTSIFVKYHAPFMQALLAFPTPQRGSSYHNWTLRSDIGRPINVPLSKFHQHLNVYAAAGLATNPFSALPCVIAASFPVTKSFTKKVGA
jgi:hypothetical protein